jgi:hypothetical protein
LDQEDPRLRYYHSAETSGVEPQGAFDMRECEAVAFARKSGKTDTQK